MDLTSTELIDTNQQNSLTNYIYTSCVYPQSSSYQSASVNNLMQCTSTAEYEAYMYLKQTSTM